MFFEDELIALRDQNKAHAEALEEDPSMAGQGGLFAGDTAVKINQSVPVLLQYKAKSPPSLPPLKVKSLYPNRIRIEKNPNRILIEK